MSVALTTTGKRDVGVMATVKRSGVSAISGATLEKARTELGEDPDKRADKIAEFRERIHQMIEKQENRNVTFERQDDRFLLCFLRARKFSIERALQLYMNYYKFRHKHACHFKDYSPHAVEHVLRTGMFAVLDTPTISGSKVLVISPSRVDLDKISHADMFKALLLILDKLIESEEAQVHGLSVLQENEGVSLLHVMKVSASEFARSNILFELIQEAFPARFKSAHMVRQPWYISILYNMAKPFIKQKFRERIHMHGRNLHSLHQYIPQSKLPSDFGGPLPPLSSASLLQLFKLEPVQTSLEHSDHTTECQGLVHITSDNQPPPDMTNASHWLPELGSDTCSPNHHSAQLTPVD